MDERCFFPHSAGVGARLIRLRYGGTCGGCGRALPAATTAWWDGDTGAIRCAACVPAASPGAPSLPVHRGVAGASAQREFDRRKGKRETRIRADHPHVGGLLLALTDQPQ